MISLLQHDTMQRKSSKLSCIQQIVFSFLIEQILSMILTILLNFTPFLQSRGETMASQTQNIFNTNIHRTLIWAKIWLSWKALHIIFQKKLCVKFNLHVYTTICIIFFLKLRWCKCGEEAENITPFTFIVVLLTTNDAIHPNLDNLTNLRVTNCHFLTQYSKLLRGHC